MPKTISSILFPLCLFAFASCQTVKEVQSPAEVLESFPDLKPRLIRADLDSAPVKIRKPGPIHIFLSTGEALSDRSKALQELALLRLIKSMEFPDIVYHSLSDPMAQGSTLDGKLNLKFVPGKTGNEFGIALNLEGGERKMQVNFMTVPASVPTSVEIVRENGAAKFLTPGSAYTVVSTGYNLQEIHSLLQDAVLGTLSIVASSGDAEIRLKSATVPEKSLGKPPVMGMRLSEDEYEITAHRKGYPAQSFRFKLFAGKSRRIFLSWPDDPRASSTAFLSAPAGLRVALDDEVKGVTPLYIVGERASKIEFAEPTSDNNFTVLGLATPYGTVRDRVFFLKYFETFSAGYQDNDYWQEVESNGGLAGLVTRPMVLDNQVINISLPKGSADAVFAFTTDRESCFIERKGDTFIVRTGKQLNMGPVIKSFVPIKDDLPSRTLQFEFLRGPSKLNVRLDGSVILGATLDASAAGKLYLLWQKTGTRPMELLTIQTGPGVDR